MYAGDLAIITESKQDLQEVLDEWKGVFKKHGLRMSLEKTEVMWVGHQKEELNIRLDGKEIKQVDGFVYLGGMVTEDGHSEAEVRCRIQTGANIWRKVEGVMLDRIFFLKLKDLTRFAIQAKGPDGKWTRNPLAYRESISIRLRVTLPPEICVQIVFKHIHTASGYTIRR